MYSSIAELLSYMIFSLPGSEKKSEPMSEKKWSLLTAFLAFIALFLLFFVKLPVQNKAIVSPILFSAQKVSTLGQSKKQGYEIFGFAPYWNLNKLDNVDFTTL